MSVEIWDIDQAVTYGPLDEELEGCCSFDRYGVTGREEIAGEPLDVALAQEERDVAGFSGSDDQWLLVDDEGYGRAVGTEDGNGPEAAAMHMVSL